MPAPRPNNKEAPGLLNDTPSKWERTKQILWDSNINAPIRGWYNLMNTPDYVLSGAGTPEEMEAAVASAWDAASGVTAGSAMIPKPSNVMTMGIKAYHGSPHSFDKFSTEKIGTGEGAQAYGHGLYFADVEGTAKGYRNNLGYGSGNSPLDTAKRLLISHGDDREGALATARAAQARAEASGDFAAIDHARQVRNIINTDPHRALGHMYEVEIKAEPGHFLQYDRPMREQPQSVRDAFDAFGYDPEENAGSVLDYLQKNEGDPAEIASRLREYGVPGVRYLDGVSRKNGVETPSYNYVVFDDNLVSVLRKYGIAGLLGTGAAYNATQDRQEVQ